MLLIRSVGWVQISTFFRYHLVKQFYYSSKKKKVLRERRKLRDKMNLKMVLTKDEPVIVEDTSLFRLSEIRNAGQLRDVAEKNLAVLDEHLNDEQKEEAAQLPLFLKYDRDDPIPEVFESDADNDENSSSSDEKGLGRYDRVFNSCMMVLIYLRKHLTFLLYSFKFG